MNSSQHGSRHRCRWATITPLICLLGHLTLSHAATVTYDFNITWVTANPDGMADRPVIGINGAWPLPIIRVDVGDRLIVNVLNSLGNQSTSLHFHGLFQNGTNEMDGPVYVTQCPIPPGSRFTYNFTIDQPGTYWYHSHTHGQYPDGLRAPLIVHDPASPFRDLYDEEVVMSVSDWYHEQMPGLLKWFISKANPTGAEPVPKSALLNETQNLTVLVTPGRTYLFRMVNIGAFAGQYVWFEGHNVTVVEIDGVYTHPTETGMIYLAAAQRYSFLITARDDTEGNFPFVASMDTDMFDTLPDDLNWNVTGWLVYDASKPLPDPAVLPDPSFSPLDDTTLLPWDNQTLLGEPDRIVTLDVAMDNLGDGANYAFFNNITYVSPKIPTLYTVLTTGDNNLNLATDPAVYGTYTSSFVLEKNQIVEVVVNNRDAGKHPFHLHGHHFQTVFRSDEDAGDFISDYYLQNLSATVAPMRRDTVVVRPNGHLVLRFRADNPGVWLFHCHIEWHVASGLVATFIEAPHEIIQQKRTRTLPADHLAACVAAGVPTRGNAAGKDGDDLLDLSGENAPPGPLPAGFTAQGIVAFVFSCVTGLLGVAVVVWYGLAEPPLQDGEEGQGQGQGQQQEVEKGWNGAGETKMGINGDGSDGVVGQMGGDGTGNEVGMGRGVIRAA